MYWRMGAAYRRRGAETNKTAFHSVVLKGPPPGLIAFHGNLALGWCQLTPRDDLPWLDRVWRLRRIDDLPVWSISCFYVRKGYRRRGITTALIEAAVAAAKAAGAPVLEAYPLDANLTPSASGTGYSTPFLRAGFEIVARHVAARSCVLTSGHTRRLGRNRVEGFIRHLPARRIVGSAGPPWLVRYASLAREATRARSSASTSALGKNDPFVLT
jgi:GNAT superfamily N-acetyltransferase